VSSFSVAPAGWRTDHQTASGSGESSRHSEDHLFSILSKVGRDHLVTLTLDCIDDPAHLNCLYHAYAPQLERSR